MCSHTSLSVEFMNLLGVTALSVEVYAGDVKLGVMSKTSLFHINDFDDLMPYQKFLHTPQSGAPQKCFQSDPAHSKAGPARLYSMQGDFHMSPDTLVQHVFLVF